MSLINFLNYKLKPSVESDTICEDGYSANNLIADDKQQLSRGFMAFSVTKPPVDIVFEFPKAIDIKIIKLWNTNGAIRSTAFEIHGKSEGIWVRVAYVRELSKANSVAFCHQSEYNSRSDVNTGNLPPCEKVFFFRTAQNVLTNTKWLKITIRRTQKCPPVLRKVQVWGLPARSLGKADRELIKTIWNEIRNPLDNQNPTTQRKQCLPTHNVSELNMPSMLQIPEEFLDAITWELMIFPTVLPSGKVVDQSTIEKYSEVEAKWGRLPSDPFTGLEFTSQRKPILDLSIKARMEKFLMEHADNFKTVPRSLGTARIRRSKTPHVSQYAIHSSSFISGTVSKLTASTTLAAYTSSAASMQQLPPILPIAKKPKLSNDSIKYLISQDINFDEPTTYPHSAVTQTTASVTSIMASSIDSAIKNALQSVSCFTSLPEETKPSRCICCNSPEFAYEIKTCKHLLCRGCLVQLTKEQKCTCKTSFRRADVERYHKF